MSAASDLPAARAAGLDAWIELTKPRIVSLVLCTGLPPLLLAAGRVPPARLLWGTLAGIALSAASAASFNHYFDRDVDALMRRTRTRPLPSGRLPASAATSLGFVLAGLAWVTLLVSANLLAAVLAMLSIAYYALLYTVWLKRRTPENIVIGGGAGASAPLIAWAAATGRVELPAVLLAAIVFLWTPPHFWALSLYRRDDYARAGIPMLPVTHGVEFTRLQVLLYTVLLVVVTLLPYLTHMSGLVYLGAALVLNGWFLYYALILKISARAGLPMRVFRFSVTYLMWLFAALLVDHYCFIG